MCRAINQTEREQSRPAEEEKKEDTSQAGLQKVVINYDQLKAVADRAILHLSGLQQRARKWKEVGEKQSVELLLKTETDTTVLKGLKPLLNTHLDSEFTTSRKKPTALTSVGKEDPKQRRGMQQ